MRSNKTHIACSLATIGLALAAALAIAPPRALDAGPAVSRRIDVESIRESWRVLDPITAGNLTIYPVVSNLKADSFEFLTLDDGVASGEVRIAERGALENGMIRRRPTRRWPPVETDVVPAR